MRVTKFGKAILIGALSAGVVFGVTSCVQSFTVGFLYVTGTVTASTGDSGIISGFKIDHNTGKLAPINGLPVPSGGANPVRAVLLSGSRFLYVLNRGVNAEGNGDCTTTDPCQGSNITQFVVGGNGILTPQETFFTQGINPFRLVPDSSGNFLLALDHDAPSAAACKVALGASATSCGDVTIFQIDQTTGRLSVVQNAAVTQANCPSNLFPCPLTYFPVPANPVDVVVATGFVLTLTAPNAQTAYPYGGGGTVWPYSYSATSGQLTVSANSSQPLAIGQGNAIITAGGVVYVLDNEPITLPPGGTFNSSTSPITYPGQILPYTVGTGGALQSQTGGIIPDAAGLANPIQLLVESKNKYLYVANQGNNVTGNNNPESGIAAYFITTSPNFELSFVAPANFGSGSGPQCIVEDPSDQFIYEANEFDSSITGTVLDPNSGQLDPLRVTSTYSLQGPATWCLVDGRTG
jgi:6-phosphogluconolactonase (cycloisomerase 2 family)